MVGSVMALSSASMNALDQITDSFPPPSSNGRNTPGSLSARDGTMHR